MKQSVAAPVLVQKLQTSKAGAKQSSGLQAKLLHYRSVDDEVPAMLGRADDEVLGMQESVIEQDASRCCLSTNSIRHLNRMQLSSQLAVYFMLPLTSCPT